MKDCHTVMVLRPKATQETRKTQLLNRGGSANERGAKSIHSVRAGEWRMRQELALTTQFHCKGPAKLSQATRQPGTRTSLGAALCGSLDPHVAKQWGEGMESQEQKPKERLSQTHSTLCSLLLCW